MPIVFLSPMWFLAIIPGVLFIWFWNKRQPALGHSNISGSGKLRNRSLLVVLPAVLFLAAWAAMTVALARPALPHVSETETIQTRDIIVAMDISGSMDSPITGYDTSCSYLSPAGCTPTGGKKQDRKIDVAPRVIRYFVQLRQGDRVALAVFDDDTYWHWPLTSDLNVIVQKTKILSDYTGGGTNFDGPSEDSYSPGIGPIQAAIDHFSKYSKAKSKVFILVTDGGAPISAKRFAELKAQMLKLGIHMYVLGVGDEWVNNDPITNDLRRFVQAVGGKIINAANEKELRAGAEAISSLEKSSVQLDKQTDYRDLYQYFVALSILLWLSFLLTNPFTRQTA